jgi:Cu/Ag efflux protein CusF
MKYIVLTAGVLSAALALAACGQKTEMAQAPAAAPEPAAAPATTPATDNMAGMNMAAEGAKMAKGMGTVTAVDATAGTITVNHEAIPEAKWPAMTMGFKSTPALAQSVKVGDKVMFDLKLENGGGEITAIQKQ